MRVLVCGVVNDRDFVQASLTEVDQVYGPITCVIHNNHAEALAWQQRAQRKRRVLQLPIVEQARDGVAAGERCRDRMFEARPEIVVIFEVADPEARLTSAERMSKTDYVRARALRLGLEVVTYTPVRKIKKAPLEPVVGFGYVTPEYDLPTETAAWVGRPAA